MSGEGARHFFEGGPDAVLQILGVGKALGVGPFVRAADLPQLEESVFLFELGSVVLVVDRVASLSFHPSYGCSGRGRGRRTVRSESSRHPGRSCADWFSGQPWLHGGIRGSAAHPRTLEINCLGMLPLGP